MIGAIIYGLACFAVAVVITVIAALFKPIKNKDEAKSWRVLLVSFIACLAAPYAYYEVLTRTKGANMDVAYEDVLVDADVAGEVVYYKVVEASGDKAKTVVVANDKDEGGFPERAVFTVELKRGEQGWVAESYEVVNSFARQKDGFTFPPYW